MTARQACEQARVDENREACRTAREQARATLKALRTHATTAITTHRTAIRAARKAFWSGGAFVVHPVVTKHA